MEKRKTPVREIVNVDGEKVRIFPGQLAMFKEIGKNKKDKKDDGNKVG